MQAVGLLEELGYTNLRHYPGGMEEWIATGGPLEGRATETIAIGETMAAARPEPSPAVRGLAPSAVRSRGRLHALKHGAIDALASSSYGFLARLWLGIVLGCGLVYWVAGLLGMSALTEAGAPVGTGLGGVTTAIYFSFVTATSLGLGDVLPHGLMRVLAIAEAASGLLLFGCVISKLVSRRQEELLEETHRLAFETRLGRVRTNLHLVLSDLQSITAECTEAQNGGKLLPRVESATMVFAGEMRAIHDLLYRPQEAPEESVLEALLANLAAGLREMRELLDHRPDARAHSPVLDATLVTIGDLAAEICGECVPREYAPGLKVWMDRIQELARGLRPA